MTLKNRIILISGCPGTGKTTMAIELAKRLKIDQVVSTDIVRGVLRSVSSRDKLPFLFTVTHEAWIYFGKKDSENIWKGFVEHCRSIYSTLNYLLEKSYEEGRDIIIEGAHILPEFVKEVKARYHNVFAFFLRVSEDNVLIKRFDMKNALRTRVYQGWLNNFKIIRQIEDRLLKNSSQFIVIDNFSFDSTENTILNEICGQNEV